MAGLTFPFPALGEVHNYEYLFAADAAQGAIEGRKARPVLVIAADPATRRVVVLPITTKGEADGRSILAIPLEIGRAMGLPRPEESVILTAEANIFTWVGHDLRPVAGTKSSRFGRATPRFTKASANRFTASEPKVSCESAKKKSH